MRPALLGGDLTDAEVSRLVTGVAAVLLAAQLVFRAWGLYPAWFFLDDYILLGDARRAGLSSDYLMEPYGGHLMPVGRLVVWVVEASGPVNWALAATLTLAMQLLASLAAWWMLTTLFGVRWQVLVPYVLYLSSTMTFPALIWWAPALNLVPVQACFFAAVAAWVTHLRTRRRTWLWVTVAVVVAGLACDVKASLVLPVLVFLAGAYFEEGSILARVRSLLRGRLLALAAVTVPVAVYAAYYLTQVPQITQDSKASDLAAVADSMLGTAFPVGVLGGPWRWANLAPPTAYADPPGWTVHVSWVLLAAAVAYGWLRRVRTLRAWVVLLGYLLVAWWLLATTRGVTFGRVLGLEYRYLTDVTCALVLAVGLAFLPLAGAPGSSAPRQPPLLTRAVPRVAVVALTIVVALSGCYSSAVYAGYWHRDNASDKYMHNLQADLRRHGAVDLVDEPVRESVLSQLSAPRNTTRELSELLSDRVSFPESSPHLVVVDADGGLRQAQIQLGLASKPGPVPDCGWLVDAAGADDIPLTGRAFEYSWWLRIGYLASADSPVTVSAGRTRVESNIERGVHSLYVKVEGTFVSVRIEGLSPGTRLCVDTVEVGHPVPGAVLP
jgi:hypothetical protein